MNKFCRVAENFRESQRGKKFFGNFRSQENQQYTGNYSGNNFRLENVIAEKFFHRERIRSQNNINRRLSDNRLELVNQKNFRDENYRAVNQNQALQKNFYFRQAGKNKPERDAENKNLQRARQKNFREKNYLVKKFRRQLRIFRKHFKKCREIQKQKHAEKSAVFPQSFSAFFANSPEKFSDKLRQNFFPPKNLETPTSQCFRPKNFLSDLFFHLLYFLTVAVIASAML